MQETGPRVQVVFPYKYECTVAMVDGQGMLLPQHTFLLSNSVLTPWPPMGIKLAAVVLPGGDEPLIFEPNTPREQLDNDVMTRLKANVLLPGVWLK